MSEREMSIPRNTVATAEGQVQEVVAQQVAQQVSSDPAPVAEQVVQEAPVQETPKILTEEEAEIREKVFFEEDEQIRLRDGKSYRVPPLGIRDARKLMKVLNTIDSGVIIANLISDDDEDPEADRYDELLEVLLMAFKPYYSHITKEYLADFVDVETAKKIIDIMIGMNGLKKSL